MMIELPPPNTKFELWYEEGPWGNAFVRGRGPESPLGEPCRSEVYSLVQVTYLLAAYQKKVEEQTRLIRLAHDHAAGSHDLCTHEDDKKTLRDIVALLEGEVTCH